MGGGGQEGRNQCGGNGEGGACRKWSCRHDATCGSVGIGRRAAPASLGPHQPHTECACPRGGHLRITAAGYGSTRWRSRAFHVGGSYLLHDLLDGHPRIILYNLVHGVQSEIRCRVNIAHSLQSLVDSHSLLLYQGKKTQTFLQCGGEHIFMVSNSHDQPHNFPN